MQTTTTRRYRARKEIGPCRSCDVRCFTWCLRCREWVCPRCTTYVEKVCGRCQREQA